MSTTGVALMVWADPPWVTHPKPQLRYWEVSPWDIRYEEWGLPTFGPNQGVRYIEEVRNGHLVYRFKGSLARDPRFPS